MKQKKEPFDILFLSFDDPLLKTNLEEILEAYQGIQRQSNQFEVKNKHQQNFDKYFSYAILLIVH